MKKFQIFYAKSPEINLAPSPAEQAVHGVLFTFKLRTFGYRLLLGRPGRVMGALVDKELLCYDISTILVQKGVKSKRVWFPFGC